MLAFRWATLGLAAWALSSGIITASADTVVTPAPTTQWGTWEGWGVSLCWWAKASGTQNYLADIFFTRKTTVQQGQSLPGLGFNIVRYNAGASTASQVDGAAMVASPRISPGRQMEGFWLKPSSTALDSASWDWSVDANQRAMLIKAKQRGANQFELFSNSPMWWMCKNHNPSGDDDANQDNLAPADYQAHATYLAAVAQVARDRWGIRFTSVEPFNEPMSPYWHSRGTQEGCHFSVESQRGVINYLRGELDWRGLTRTVIAASDETSYDLATATWNSFGPETRAQVGRVNVHGYQTNGNREALYTAVAGKKLWNSEYGEADGSGLSLASNLTRDLRALHPTGWCYWQGIDGGGWGLLEASSRRRATSPPAGADASPGTAASSSQEPALRASTKYFVLAQYTRHILPGMKIIDAGEDHSVAAYDPKGKRLIIVTTNLATPQTITYNLSQFAKAMGPVTRWSTNTDGSELYVKRNDVTLSAKQFSCAFGANTVQTFEIRNVSE